MPLSDRDKELQSKMLTSKTSENEKMIYNSVPVMNTALNPEFFPGSLSKIVNAINASYDRAETARKYGADVYKKFASIILDTSSSYGSSKFEEMIEKTGEDTLIEAICQLCNKIESLEPGSITKEDIINALGYTPAMEGGSQFITGIILDEEE